MKYLLDTNIAIFAMRRHTAFLQQHFRLHTGDLAISSNTQFGLECGVHRSTNKALNMAVLQAFTSRLPIEPFTHEAAAHTAAIRADLANQGLPIGPYDVMIAGHARALKASVITNNVRELSRVHGLLVEDWSV